jgi:hypothetical protein
MILIVFNHDIEVNVSRQIAALNDEERTELLQSIVSLLVISDLQFIASSSWFASNRVAREINDHGDLAILEDPLDQLPSTSECFGVFFDIS